MSTVPPTPPLPSPADKPLRYVEFTRPRCPGCQSVRLKSRHTDTLEDGTARRHSVCQNCGWKGIVIAK